MAMQFEVGHILLRIDDVGMLIHNTEDQGNIQLTPEEGNMFIQAWAMTQGALAARVQMNGHIFTGPVTFISNPMDDEDNEHDT